MKKTILLLSIILISFHCFSQQKTYGTKKIGQWTFEKFPLHYSITPFKTLTYRNTYSKKLEKYQEFNKFGQADGISILFSNNGINPDNASYYYKGEVVYSVIYFPNSNIPALITNYNKDGLLDGYKVDRDLKETGGYTTSIQKYNNGDLIEINGVKTIPLSVIYKDSLLDGAFKFESSPFVIEGIAEKGKLKRIKQTQENILMSEITFLKDSFIIKEQRPSTGYSIETRPMISNPTITNSKSYCLKYGNYNGYPNFIFPPDFHLSDLTEIISKRYPKAFETKQTYENSLLDGDFQYSQYKQSSKYSVNEYMNVYGKAEKGKLIALLLWKLDYDGRTITKYTFEGDTVKQFDLDVNTLDVKSLVKTEKIEHHVLLTNSKELGGKYSLIDHAWDNDINNPNNVLGIPIKRKGNLVDNKNGYAYFSPFTFDIENYLNIITTKP